jgi:hypothetical protein
LSEVRAWAEYCMENFDSLIKEAEEKARLAAEATAAEAAAAGSAAGASSASALKMMSEKKQTDIENLNMSDLLRSQIWQNIGASL